MLRIVARNQRSVKYIITLETNRANSGVCAFVHSRTGVAPEDTFQVFPSRLVLALTVLQA